MGVEKYILPKQIPVASCIGCPVPTFKSLDSSVYYSGLPFPVTSVINSGQGYWHTANVASVSFYPFQYLPTSNKLVFTGNISYTIYYSPLSGGNNLPGIKMRSEKYRRFIHQLKASIQNPENIPSFITRDLRKYYQMKLALHPILLIILLLHLQLLFHLRQ